MKLQAIGVLVLCAGCAATGATGATTAPKSSQNEGVVGQTAATDFTLRDLEGNDIRLSDYAGKVILVDFWATWCTPCEAELTHLQRLYKENEARGFVILGVAMDGPETASNVAPMARRYGLTFPVLLDQETKVVGVYNPKRTAPLSVLIDRKGQIARVRQGYNPGDEKLVEADVRRLLEP